MAKKMNETEAKIQEYLDGQSKKELLILAEKHGIAIPKNWPKKDAAAEIYNKLYLAIDKEFQEQVKRGGPTSSNLNDDILAVMAIRLNLEPDTASEELPPAEEENAVDETDKPAHVVEHEKRTAELEKEVAMSAIEMSRAKAAAKTAQKKFDGLCEELENHLSTDPEPTLFDQAGEKICRKCGCVEADGRRFATDKLCQDCADQLGKDKQQQEVLNTCPDCSGRGMVDGDECVTCEGTGTLTKDQPEDEELQEQEI